MLQSGSCPPPPPPPRPSPPPPLTRPLPFYLQVGYCQGMAFCAGILLMYLPEEPAFRCGRSGLCLGLRTCQCPSSGRPFPRLLLPVSTSAPFSPQAVLPPHGPRGPQPAPHVHAHPGRAQDGAGALRGAPQLAPPAPAHTHPGAWRAVRALRLTGRCSLSTLISPAAPLLPCGVSPPPSCW